MVNEVFEYMGKNVRVIGDTDEPLFCLKDVCDILELRVDVVVDRLKSDETGKGDDPGSTGVVSKQPFTDSKGRTQQMYFVNEDGLYDVILDSRKAVAKKFRKWVVKVIKEIRREGMYEDDEWTEIRNIGIEERLSLTSAISLFQDYCSSMFIDPDKYIRDGCKSLYSTISVMINVALSLKIKNNRKNLSKKKLKMIEICETKVTHVIIKDILEHKHPKKIMKHIKRSLKKIRDKMIDRKLLADLYQIDMFSYIDGFSDNDYDPI